MSEENSMSCMCGDKMCSSCGPAQGYDPDFESLCEWLEYDLLCDFPEVIDVSSLAEDLANRLTEQPEYVQEALRRRQRQWLNEGEWGRAKKE